MMEEFSAVFVFLLGAAAVLAALMVMAGKFRRGLHALSGGQAGKFSAAAKALRLRPTEDGLGGFIHRHPVEVRRLDGMHALAVTIRPRGDDEPVPAELQVALRQLLSGEGNPVGDLSFDEKFSLSGDSATIMALFDAETRQFMAGRARFTMITPLFYEAGTLRFTVADRIEDTAAFIVETVKTAVRLAARCALPKKQIPALLLQNARRDPLRAVRIRNLEVLVDHFPDDVSVRKGLRALLRDGDREVRLLAARGLGAGGFAALATLVTSTDTPPEIASRALAAATLPPAPQQQPVAPIPKVLPLIRHAIAAPDEALRLAGLQALFAQADAAAEDRGRLDALREGGTEAAVIAALALNSTEERRAAVEALGAIGTVAAVAPLQALAEDSPLWRGLDGPAGNAVARIQARLAGAAAGQVALAPPAENAVGRVSLAPTGGAGRVSLPGDV